MATPTRPADRYGDSRRRLALAPALIASVALLVGVTVLDDGPFLVVRYIAAIFAGIVAVFAFQAKQWAWLPVFAAIVVAWNPVLVIPIPDPWWLVAQYVAVLAFLVAGWVIRVVVPDDRSSR